MCLVSSAIVHISLLVKVAFSDEKKTHLIPYLPETFHFIVLGYMLVYTSTIIQLACIHIQRCMTGLGIRNSYFIQNVSVYVRHYPVNCHSCPMMAVFIQNYVSCVSGFV